MSFAADASTKEAAQIQASNILTRIEQAKNRGEVRVCVCFLLGVLTHVWEKAGGAAAETGTPGVGACGRQQLRLHPAPLLFPAPTVSLPG